MPGRVRRIILHKQLVVLDRLRVVLRHGSVGTGRACGSSRSVIRSTNESAFFQTSRDSSMRPSRYAPLAQPAYARPNVGSFSVAALWYLMASSSRKFAEWTRALKTGSPLRTTSS